MISEPLLATVETLLACVALSFFISLLVGAFVRAGGNAVACRPAAYRMAAGAALMRPGERYLGSLAGPDGRITHLYLIAGRFTGDWRAACTWAARLGGSVPTCDELLLLRVMARAALDPSAVYWTIDPACADPAWITAVHADSGRLVEEHIGQSLAAVAVRRVAV